MALKSSQPRRSASLKSDKLSFRKIIVLGSPNACRSGFATFSKYWVTMDASPSRAAGWRALSPRASAPSCLELAAAPSAANQVQGEEALPDDTCRDRSYTCETSAKEAHGHSRLGDLCV